MRIRFGFGYPRLSKVDSLVPSEVSGYVTIRPVRVGLVFEPTLSAFVEAVEYATASWGGIYFPFIDPTSKDDALHLSTVLGVDVLHAVDGEPASTALSRLDGYSWLSNAEWGPFGQGEGFLPSRIQGVDWIYDEDPAEHKYALNKWDTDHPLAAVFAALYGQFGVDDFSRGAATAFQRVAHPLDAGKTIEESGRWPDDPRYYTPISFTGREVSYDGEGGRPAIVVMEPDDAKRLCLLWNVRAAGSPVIPWVNGYEEVSFASLELWLDNALEDGIIGGWKRANGQDAGPHLFVYVPPGEEPPTKLKQQLEHKGVSLFRDDQSDILAYGWRGHHPFHTDFGRFFNSESPHAQVFDIPLPQMGSARWNRKHQPGFVIAEIVIDSVKDLAPDLTLAMPAIRELTTLINTQFSTEQRFHRPIDKGRAIAVRSNSEVARISPVRSFDVMSAMAARNGWTYKQTDSGRFSSRLIDRLGGRASYVANQPSMRTVMFKAAASHTGQLIIAHWVRQARSR